MAHEDELLDRIEESEAYLSQLGVVDPWTTPQSLIEQGAWTHGQDELEEAFQILVQAGRLIWLRSFRNGQPQFERFEDRRYRSRTAETVRLLALLKQRFPNRPAIEAGRELIDGAYWHAVPRYVPDRDRPARDVLGEFRRIFYGLPNVAEAIAILAEVWDNRSLNGFQERAFLTLAERLALSRAAANEEQRSPADRAIVIQAPTGAGKTLAFYLPTLLEPLLRRLDGDERERGCSVVAVYPRIALADDQLASILQLIRPVNAVLRNKGLDPLTIGVGWSGGLRSWPSDIANQGNRWNTTADLGGGWRLSFLRCPECGKELVARNTPSSPPDLECPACRTTYPEIRLTWDEYASKPPDILITVTESLHLRLSHPRYTHVFGVKDRRRPPAVVLMDEAHLYSGLLGAQVASLVRRFRRQLRLRRSPTDHPATIVGLSATLEEPTRFFASLTGVEAAHILEISPSTKELKRAGTEALVFARVAAGATALSGGIQSIMAMAHAHLRDDQAAAERLFAFTDNLDLVNRLGADTQDAERQQLYRLRLPGDPQLRNARPPHDCSECDAGPDRSCHIFERGECWWVSKRTGQRPVSIGTVSSQGGSASANRVVVASPSLEVGIDDARVMATFQYLGPPSAGNFVQRRGRAGRTPGSRPLSVLLLSPYRPGDVFLFRNPASLASPRLPPIPLNPNNTLARRTHAFAAILDLYATSDGAERAEVALRQRVSEPALIAFARWLTGKRNLAQELAAVWGTSSPADDAATHRLFWSPGTGLLSKVLPEFLQPQSANRDPIERLGNYLPRTLFSELKVPDFTVRTPWTPDPRDEEIEIAFPITMPGNVTHRYSYGRPDGMWVAVDAGTRSVVAEDTYELLDTGREVHASDLPERVRLRLNPDLSQGLLPLLRPLGLREQVVQPFQRVLRLGPSQPNRPANSQCFPIMRRWVARDDESGLAISPLGTDVYGFDRGLGGLARLVPTVEALLTSQNASLESFSVTIGGQLSTTWATGQKSSTVFGFVRQTEGGDGKPVALGWEGRVDGFCFELDMERLSHLSRTVLASDETLRNDMIWKVFAYEFYQRAQDAGLDILSCEKALRGIQAALASFTLEGRDRSMVGALSRAFTLLQDVEVESAWAQAEEQAALHEENPDIPSAEGSDVDQIVDLKEVTRWLVANADIWHDSVDRLNDPNWFHARVDEILVHTVTRMLRVAALRAVGAADARDLLADDGLFVREVQEVGRREVYIFESALEGVGFCQNLFSVLERNPEAWGDQCAAVVRLCPVAREDEFVRRLIRRPEIDQVTAYLRAAQEVHDLGGLARLQQMHRDLFGHALLDWQLLALRNRSHLLLTQIADVPNWWDISRQLIELDAQLADSCGYTPALEQLVHTAIARSEPDSPIHRFRSWLTSQVPASEIQKTLTLVLERYALRSCSDGCPDCIAGLPDEVEPVRRLAQFLLSRRLAAAVIELDWTEDAFDLASGREASLPLMIQAACQHGRSEVGLLASRDQLDLLLAIIEDATGSGITVGLKALPVTIRAFDYLSDNRIYVTLGIAS